MPRAVGFLLSRAARRAREALETELAPYELRLQHFVLLMTIARTGSQSQQRLGACLGFDRTTMVALVDQLEAAGLAQRDRDPQDRRAYLVELTGEGRALLPKLRARAAAAERATLAPLTEAERATFAELLLKVASAGGAGDEPGPPGAP